MSSGRRRHGGLMTTGADYVSTTLAQERTRTQRWYVLVLLIVGYAIYNLDKSILSILIEPIKKEFALSDTQLSLLTGVATTAPFALACIPLGMLGDRISRKWLLFVLMTGWSAMTGVAGLATSVTLLMVSRIGVGTFEAGFTPVSMSILSDSFPRSSRATAMGLFGLGAPAGIFLGMALGGLVASIYGWRAAFFLAGLPGLLIAVLIITSIREPERGVFDDKHKGPPARFSAVIANLWRDRALLNIALGMTSCNVVAATIAVWTPSFLIRVHDMPLRTAGFAAALIAGICGALGSASGGALADRVGRHSEWKKLIVSVSGAGASVVFGLIGLLVVEDTTTALVMVGAMAYFTQYFMGTGYALASSLAPLAMRTATVSILLVSFNVVSYGMGTMVVGIVSDATQAFAGARSIALGMAAATLFSGVGALLFWRAAMLLRVRA
jgi:MFS family permease